MRQPFVAGNWKMNGSHNSIKRLLEGIKAQAQDVGETEIAVFPPFVYLLQCKTALEGSSVAWGAQDVSAENNGAYTGEVSASMLVDFACRYVIVGHSERRMLYGEDNKQVAAKFRAAIHVGLRPILCVGETLNEREAGKTLTIIEEQLAAVLTLNDNLFACSDAVIAYEPIWAIGTGRTATPEQAQEVHAAIRKQLAAVNPDLAEKLRILYGGSVKPANASALMAMPDIDGALVGGASLDAKQFIEIGQLCNL